MKRIFKDIKRYSGYMIYSAGAELRTEVANSYLNWFWWILDPLLLMMVYTLMVKVIFHTQEPYFPLFVFIGLTVWGVFNKVVKSSVKLVKSNKGIVSKIYMPKYILIVVKLFINFFKMSISFGLIFVMLIVYKITLTFNILYIFPLLILLFIVTFGFGSILMHFGIFVEDLSNVIDVLLRLVFYMSGVFFSINTRVPAPYSDIMLKLNPIAYIIDEFRNVLLFGQSINFGIYFIWLAIGLVLSYIGIRTIYKYENSYAKVI
jgi:ABC-type polysaccharide/polyol phosphate export permease